MKPFVRGLGAGALTKAHCLDEAENIGCSIQTRAEIGRWVENLSEKIDPATPSIVETVVHIISHFHIIRHFRSLVNLHTYREIILVKLLRSKANSFIRYGISKEK